MNRAIRFLFLSVVSILLISCLILECLLLSWIICSLAAIRIPSELVAFIPILIRIIYAEMSICLALSIFSVEEDLEGIRLRDAYELFLQNGNPGYFQFVRFAL